MKTQTLNISRGSNVPAFLFLLITIVIGLFIFDDYGIAWDEPWQIETSQVNFDYIFKGDPSLVDHEENIYGMAIEMPLKLAEELFGFDDPRQIYLMRHILGHLLFLFGIFIFIKLIFSLTKKHWIAILAGLFLYLSPRIFAHSFFNTKDIPFMVFVIFCQYFLLRAYKKPWPGIIWLGIVSGLMVNIRLMGILIVGLSALILMIKCLREGNWRNALIFSFVYILITIFVTYATWPYLWQSPLVNFVEALRIMSQYPWDDPVLFLGKSIPGNQIPWYYTPVWITISTPIIYILFFVLGCGVIVGGLLRNSSRFIQDEKMLFRLLNIAIFFIPLAVVILLKSTLYDDWRQLYFIYPSFLIIAVLGLDFIVDHIHSRAQKIMVYSLLAIGLLSPALFFIINHPHQQVYLNELISRDEGNVRYHFEMDYWGVSYRQALEFILEDHQGDNIKVMVANYPGLYNENILKEADRERLNIRFDHSDPDYFVSNYRYHPGPYSEYGDPVFSIEVYNSEIISVWKLSD